MRFREGASTTYLYLFLEGEFDIEEIPWISDQILDSCARHQGTKILLDQRGLSGNPTAMERFRMATVFTAKFIQARLTNRIPACVFAMVGQEPMVDPKRFGETVALNRGIPIKVFTDFQEALRWLGVEGTGEK